MKSRSAFRKKNSRIATFDALRYYFVFHGFHIAFEHVCGHSEELVKDLLRHRMPLFGGLAEPFRGFRKVFDHAFAIVIADA